MRRRGGGAAGGRGWHASGLGRHRPGGAARELARLYDLRFDPRYTPEMLYPSPTDGHPVGVDFLVPQSVEDLQRRRRFHQIWAEATFGLMGRSTDFLSAILTAFSVHPELFGEHAEKVKTYYEYVRDSDLFLTHTLVDPPIDRSKPPSQQ